MGADIIEYITGKFARAVYIKGGSTSIEKAPASIQDWTAVAQNAIIASAEYDLSGIYAAILHIQAALDTTTPHTGTRFLVQISGASSGDEDWQDYTDFVALIGTAATDAIEDNPLDAGSTAITLTGHSMTELGIWLFIEDSTLANSELVFESAESTNEVDILDGTTNAHASGVNIFNIAMVQNVSLSEAVNRVRVVVDNSYDDNGSTLDYKMLISKVTGV